MILIFIMKMFLFPGNPLLYHLRKPDGDGCVEKSTITDLSHAKDFMLLSFMLTNSFSVACINI